MSVKEEAVELRRKNPCWTLKQIGDKLGKTRECIRQNLKKAQVETRHIKIAIKNNCPSCNKEIYNRINCKYKRKFCSRECQIDYSKITLVCSQCGKLFTKKINDILEYQSRQNNPLRINRIKAGYFCDKKCFGKWVGKNRWKRNE